MSKNKDLIIKTESVGKGFATSNPIILDQTSQTALVFFPGIHSGGVRGTLVRYKKDTDDKWEKLQNIDLRSLNLYEGGKIELGTEQVKKLVEGVNNLNEISKQGISYGQAEYLVTPKENTIVITDQNKKNVINQILSSGYSDEFWNVLSKSDPDLANKISSGHIQNQRNLVVEELLERVNGNKTYNETIGDDSWQKWIYKNNWLFGVNYRDVIEKQKINLNGIMPDYLFLTTDGFIDILEIKLPTMKVIVKDDSHSGSWVWSPDANKAIGQVVNYLHEMNDFRVHIEKEIRKHHKDVSALKPRAYILIGDSKDWDQDKKDGLRKLNYSLHGIEVITYQHLIQRGESFIKAGVGIKTR